MSIDSSNNLLLVGSVPLDTAREVFATCAAAIGTHLSAIPDGEVGDRSTWVVFQAYASSTATRSSTRCTDRRRDRTTGSPAESTISSVSA
jgi:hypothetical protein